MKQLLAPIAKAATAFLGTEVFALGTAMTDGHVTVTEIVAATGGAIVVAFAAWRIPNAGR